MIVDFFTYLLKFIGIALLQVLVVNNITLSTYINPYIYISFILLLPVTTKPWHLLLIAFLTGAVIDTFGSTPGLHIAATVFMAYVRIHYLRIATTKEDIEGHAVPNMSKKGVVWFVIYCFLMTFAHHTILFFLEIYRFSEFLTTLSRVVLSTLVTVLMIVVGQLLFYTTKSKHE
ncbi:MAG: rod shape-determining protein MreD [Bacteroidia bacterium]|nr:rod shape-determining protein MreD [Bacteroidia bacterium]MCC7533519.1 rod shape-determining protein MreD [Bacteroidia bacterium]MCZ2139817.1 rod shape-determining protein MreD [Bacteroidia bacterium]